MSFWKIFAVGAILGLSIAGCSSATESSDSSSDSSIGAADDPVTLDLWIFEGEEEFLPNLKEGFEAEHSNITVNITEIPEDSYVTKIDTALVAGSPPDIGFVGMNFEPRWLKAGQVLSLDETISDKGIDTDAFNQPALGSCVLEGSVYCLGSETGAVVLFYNKDLFDAAGLDYPSTTEPMTIDEYASLARELTQASSDPAEHVYGAVAVGGGAPHWWMNPAAHFSEDGRKAVGFANDDTTKHTYDVLTAMVLDGSAPSGGDPTLSQSVDLLAAERVAMSVEGNFETIPVLESAGIRWGAAPPPVETEGQDAYIPAWTDQWGVFSDSDNPTEAMEFVAFVATRGSEMRVEIADHYPLDTSIALADEWAAKSDGRAEVVDVINLPHSLIFVPGFWDATAALNDAVALIIAGDATVADALDEAAEAMQERLDRAWETWDEIEQG